jgi:hypothetical protein
MGSKYGEILAIILISTAISSISALPEEPQLTYYQLYDAGRQAYNEERWYECAAFMRRSLEDYKLYRDVLWNCHQKCDRQIRTDPFPIDTASFRDEKKAIYGNKGVLEARILEKFVKKALCLRRCRTDRLPDRPSHASDSKVDEYFREMKPYSYMQLCYWKVSLFIFERLAFSFLYAQFSLG